MKSDVFIFSNQNSFRSLCENGINLEVRQGERIGPSYVKLVQRFVYLVAEVAVKLPS